MLRRLNIDWKNVVIYVILPTVVAGFFSVAPKLYDIWTEPNAELKYSLINGPEIQVEKGFQRIILITVQNTGKKPLTNVNAELAILNGKFESYKVQEKSGINLLTLSKDNQITLTVKKIFPNEYFSISLLLLNSVPESSPSFTLRSEEVLGTEKLSTLDKDIKTTFLSGLLVALSVLTMSIVAFITITKKGSGFPVRYKQDAIFYIPARLGLTEIINELQLKDFDLTYLRMADVLLSHGLQTSGDKRQKYIFALKLMLLIKNIAKTSQLVIINNIQLLAERPVSLEELQEFKDNAIDTSEVLNFREVVEKFIIQHLKL